MEEDDCVISGHGKEVTLKKQELNRKLQKYPRPHRF